MDDETRDNLKKPQSAPAVPKELLSARPAMTKVRPKVPDPADEANEAIKVPEPTPEELADRQERIDYLKGLRTKDKKKGKGGKKWLIILIVLLVLAAIAAGAFMLLKKPKTTTKDNAAQTTNQPANTTTPAQDAEAADMKTYDSPNFALTFKYPADWTVNDATTGLTVISPKTTLTDADGEDTPAAVVLHIRTQQSSIPEFKSGNAAAVLTSKNIAYTAPATGQRGNTYLSFVQYASTTTTGALDSIYITGNAGYQKGQDIPMKDVAKVNPLINVSFVDCSKNCTPTSLAISVSAASWSSNSLNQTVETMLRSLTIN
jgi:cytoskeletal protein RodZ